MLGTAVLISLPVRSATLNFSKGKGNQKLVIYYPLNEAVYNDKDAQQQIIGN